MQSSTSNRTSESQTAKQPKVSFVKERSPAKASKYHLPNVYMNEPSFISAPWTMKQQTIASPAPPTPPKPISQTPINPQPSAQVHQANEQTERDHLTASELAFIKRRYLDPAHCLFIEDSL